MKTSNKSKIFGLATLFCLSAVAADAAAELPLEAFPDVSKPIKLKENRAKDFVIIVTVEDYDVISDVSGAVQSGEDWYKFFNLSMRVPKDRILFIKEKDVKRPKLIAAITDAMRKTDPEGDLWFVYVGHGLGMGPKVEEDSKKPVDRSVDNNEPALLMYDAELQINVLEHYTMRQSDLMELFDKGKQKQNILFLDSCFSGEDQKGKAFEGTMAVVPVNLLKDLPVKKTTHVLAAASKGYARPLENYPKLRPAFSYMLLGALQGWGDNNNDSVVTVNEAMSFMSGFAFMNKQAPVYIPMHAAGDDLVLTRLSAREKPLLDVFTDGGSCSERGQTRTKISGWRCCWPGQLWSEEQGQCSGAPACDGLTTSGGDKMVREGQWCFAESVALKRDDDGDKIPNFRDKCPTAHGQGNQTGCDLGEPQRGTDDADGDGVMDSADRCPDVVGVREHSGCPAPIADSDEDGVPDNRDACPKEAGTWDNRGCPLSVAAAQQPKQEPDDSIGLSTPLLIGGGVIVAAGGVLLGSGLVIQSSAESALAAQSDSQSNISDDLATADSLKTFGYVGLGVGAAALITGFILMDDNKSALRLVPGPGDIGVGVGLSF
jgi:hypothetical protein